MKIAASGRCQRHSAWGTIATLCAASAGLTLAACGPGVATPIPEPPTLVLSRIGPPELEMPETATAGEGHRLFGRRGSAPPGALIRVTNLERMDLPSVTTVKPDGSFEISVVVVDGEELRFDWLRGTERGAPQDAHFIKDVVWSHVEPSARFACLELSPGFELDFAQGTTQALGVQSSCAASVSLSAPRARLGLADFQLPTQLPLSLLSNESVALRVGLNRTQTGALEDTLFFDVTLGSEMLRYPVTLVAPALP